MLFDRKGDRPLIPDSTAKLATAAAALKTFGTTHRLTTTTKRSQDTVYLVGGGDTTLMLAYAARGLTLTDTSPNAVHKDFLLAGTGKIRGCDRHLLPGG